MYNTVNDTVVVVYEPIPGGLQCKVFLRKVRLLQGRCTPRSDGYPAGELFIQALERGKATGPPYARCFGKVFRSYTGAQLDGCVAEELILTHPAFFEFDGEKRSKRKAGCLGGCIFRCCAEANGMVLAAQQGTIRFFQFWVELLLIRPDRASRSFTAVSSQNHETYSLVFSVYEERFEGKYPFCNRVPTSGYDLVLQKFGTRK